MPHLSGLYPLSPPEDRGNMGLAPHKVLCTQRVPAYSEEHADAKGGGMRGGTAGVRFASGERGRGAKTPLTEAYAYIKGAKTRKNAERKREKRLRFCICRRVIFWDWAMVSRMSSRTVWTMGLSTMMTAHSWWR